MKSSSLAVMTPGINPDDWHQIGNGDLTPLILCRLPAKSIIKFRCVCRRWLEITSAPSFILSHTISNPRPPIDGLILKSQQPNEALRADPHQSLFPHPIPGRQRSVPSLSFIPSDCVGVDGDYISDRLTPLSSCNGLILCKGPRDRNTDSPYYVCNPTTKEWRGIPNPPIDDIVVMALFFDPSSTVCRRPTLHYKIVCIGEARSRRFDSEYWIQIYSSLTGAWTFGPYIDDPILLIYSDRGGVCCGGAVHWLRMRRHPVEDWDQQAMSVSFEMEGECLRTTPLPINPGECKRWIKYFGCFGNRLHLILRFGCERDILRIYELSHDNLGWIPLYCFNKLQVDIFPSKPVCFLRCETEDFLFLSHKTKDHRMKLISYRLREKQSLCESNYMPRGISCIPTMDYIWHFATPFACSLFSP